MSRGYEIALLAVVNLAFKLQQQLVCLSQQMPITLVKVCMVVAGDVASQAW